MNVDSNKLEQNWLKADKDHLRKLYQLIKETKKHEEKEQS